MPSGIGCTLGHGVRERVNYIPVRICFTVDMYGLLTVGYVNVNHYLSFFYHMPVISSPSSKSQIYGIS